MDIEESCGCCTFEVGAYWWTAFCEEHSYYGQRDLIIPMEEDEMTELLTVKSASVKEVLERTEKPTVEIQKSCSLNSSLILESIEFIANEIHRKSLRGPANFIVVSDYMAHIIKQNSFKKIIENEFKDCFSDAELIGCLNNRYFVYQSDKLSNTMLLIGRFGDGAELIYETKDDDDDVDGVDYIPNVNVIISKNPLFAKGQVSYWGFLKGN